MRTDFDKALDALNQLVEFLKQLFELLTGLFKGAEGEEGETEAEG